jgi:hypothetical protein
VASGVWRNGVYDETEKPTHTGQPG